MQVEKSHRRYRVRYKRRGHSARLEIIVAAIFVVIGIVLTVTLVRLGGDAPAGVAKPSAGVSASPAYQPVFLDPTVATA